MAVRTRNEMAAAARSGAGRPEARLPAALRPARDLTVVGLSARLAGSLRNALTRAEIEVDVDSDDVRVPASPFRPVALERLLGVVTAWAAASGVSRVQVVYGARAYVLTREPGPLAGGEAER